MENKHCPNCHSEKVYVWYDTDSYTKFIMCMYCGHEEECDEDESDGHTLQEVMEASSKFAEAMQQSMPSAKDYTGAWGKGFNPTTKISDVVAQIAHDIDIDRLTSEKRDNLNPMDILAKEMDVDYVYFDENGKLQPGDRSTEPEYTWLDTTPDK